MFVESEVCYFWCKQKMTSFRGQASLGKKNITWGQANGTAVLPDQKSKQSRVTSLSLYKHCLVDYSINYVRKRFYSAGLPSADIQHLKSFFRDEREYNHKKETFWNFFWDFATHW